MKENLHFNKTVTYDEDNITEYDCQQYCSNDSSFAHVSCKPTIFHFHHGFFLSFIYMVIV